MRDDIKRILGIQAAQNFLIETLWAALVASQPEAERESFLKEMYKGWNTKVSNVNSNADLSDGEDIKQIADDFLFSFVDRLVSRSRPQH